MGNRYIRKKIDVARAISLYESGMTQTEIAVKLKTSQKVIWHRFNEIGYKCRKPAKRNQWGENNSSWKGNKAKYKALHCRIYRLRGCPRKCEVCGSTDKKRKYEWASLTKDYDNPDDYKRMCQSCHAKYDNMAKNFKKKKGVPTDAD